MVAYIVVSMLLYFLSIGWPFAVIVLVMWLVLVASMLRSSQWNAKGLYKRL